MSVRGPTALRSVVALAGLSLLTACTSGALLVLTELPEDVAHVAVVAQSSAGGLLFATPVLDAEAPLRIEDLDVPLEGEVLAVYGWTTRALEGLTFGATPVRLAPAGAATLPLPTLARAGRVTGGRVEPTPVPADEVPGLTTTALQDCPTRVPLGAAVDTSCSTIGCPAVLSQTGCTLDLDLVGCGLGTARGQVDAAGRASTEATSALGACTEVAAPDGVTLALRCARMGGDSCRVDAVDPRARARSFADVDHVLLVTPTATTTPSVRPVMAGALGALVALDDRVVVVGTPSRATNVWCTGTYGTLYSVDATTLAVRSSTTPYLCITALVRDPLGPGFLAAYGGPEAPRLGRFDPELRLRESLALDTDGQSVVRLAASASMGLVYVATSTKRGGAAGLFALSALTGGRVWTAPRAGQRYVDLVLFDDEVVALDEGSQQVYAFAEDGTFRLAAPIALACGLSSVEVARLWALREPNRWMITTQLEGAEMLVLTDTRNTGCDSASAYVAPGAEPLAIAAWPGPDPERLMVGLWTPEGEAVLARYDTREQRFEPGLVTLGEGFVGELGSVGSSAFATLPLSGELVRIRPR